MKTIDKKKRESMQNLIYSTMSALDPTGDNTKRYEMFFSNMTDDQFIAYFDNLFKNEDHYIILETVDYERDLKMENVLKAAKTLGIDLFEHIVMPYMSPDPDNPIVSQEPVPVGYLHMKVMQQMVNKKNSTSTETDKRNKFNQVTGNDKNGRSSDMENFSLAALNADTIMKELLGPRADDSVMKREMYSQIAKYGYTSLDTLPNEIENKTTLNMTDTFLIAMGIKSDLITPSLLLKKTINTKEK